MDDPRSTRWHKDSRFWRVGLAAMLLAWFVIPLVLWFQPEAVEAGIGVFGLTTFTLLGGGAASNFQQARAAVEQARNGGGV